jgi:phosphopantothenate-cysteine ligase/phosphopantothenoylcysteine decarboxylase/phosphopantothenate--cysteine ligase
VRAITNIFRGRTGTAIAEYFAENGCRVTLLTSNPALAKENANLTVEPYKTYDDLILKMEKLISAGSFDTVVHSAAVSDYLVEGVYYMKDGVLTQVSNDKKISSEHAELYLKLGPTKKIVDLIRNPWGFRGQLVKFKLQVGISDTELLDIATKSRAHSDADYIVANCLEWSHERAFIVGRDDKAHEIARNDLPKELFNRILS